MTERAAVTDPARPGPPALSGSTARLVVELKPDLDLRPEDVAALDCLIDGRPDVGVFLSRAWLSGFFADPPAGVEPALVLFRESGHLRGVVPIAVRRTFTHLRVGLLGGGLGSDRVDLLAARGFEAACADTFLAWLGHAFGRRAFVLGLRDVPVESPLWGAVHRVNAERSWRLALQPRDVHTLPSLDLAELWSSSLERESRVGHVRSLDKHRRWLERRGTVRIDVLEDLDEVMDAFETLTRLLHARWSGSEGGSALDQPRTARFHRHVLPLLLREGWLKLIRLSVDGRTVGVFYGLASGGWWGYYFAGYDREWAGRIHLGQLTLAAAIDRASQEGATEFDFLKGAERVKYLWPVRARATLSADIYSAHAGAQLARAAAATRDAAVALAKAARHLCSR